MSAVLEQQDIHGWRGEIDIDFRRLSNVKTIISSLKHLGPLRVQRPFYPEGDVCHVYLLHPPGGVVGGDSLQINLTCEDNCHAFITTPGSTKFYRSAGDTAYVTQTFTIDDECTLEWFPQENIFFPGAKVNLQTTIKLENNANFIGWEINCLGRPANNEQFLTGRLNNSLSIYRDDKLLLNEKLRVYKNRHLTAAAGLRNFPINAVFICTSCTEEQIDQARKIVEERSPDFPIGITALGDILILRALGNNTKQLQGMIIPIWDMLRPVILNKKPIKPRIWST